MKEMIIMKFNNLMEKAVRFMVKFVISIVLLFIYKLIWVNVKSFVRGTILKKRDKLDDDMLQNLYEKNMISKKVMIREKSRD